MIVARFISQIRLFCVTFLLCTFSQKFVSNGECFEVFVISRDVKTFSSCSCVIKFI